MDENEEVEGEVEKNDLGNQKTDLKAEDADDELDECEEVEHGQSWEEEDNESYNEDAEVEFLETEGIAVYSVPHNIELPSIKQIDQRLQHLENVIVNPCNGSIEHKDVAGADEQYIVNQGDLDGRAYDAEECKVGDDVGLGLNEGGCHVVPDVYQVQNSITNKLCQVRIRLETTWKSHQPFGLLLQDFKLQPLAYPMEDNECACSLCMQVNQEQYPEYNVKHHLCEQRCKLRVDGNLVEVKVKQVLVVIWLLKL